MARRDVGEKWDAEFARGVRSTREARGLTQEALAAEMSHLGYEFHQATIYKIETGKRRVSVGEAFALAGRLGSSIDGLLESGRDPEGGVVNRLWATSTEFMLALIKLDTATLAAVRAKLEFEQVAENFDALKYTIDQAGTSRPAGEVYRELLDFNAPEYLLDELRTSLAPGGKLFDLFDTHLGGAVLPPSPRHEE